MSSPFSKAFNAKNPVTPLEGNLFIKTKMDAEAAGKDSFIVNGRRYPLKMEGSPNHKHKKYEKQLEILKNDPEKAVKKGLSSEGQGGKDYEAIERLKKKIKEEEAKHTSERTESDDAQAREDEDAARGAAMEMAPLKKNASPLDRGGYVGGGDVAGGNYASTAGAYQQMFNKIEGATKEFIAGQENPDYEGKSKRQANRVARRNKRGVRKGEGTMKDGVYTANNPEAMSKFNEKTAFIDAKSITNKEMADKQKESAYDKLASLMSDEDKKKYGIIT